LTPFLALGPEPQKRLKYSRLEWAVDLPYDAFWPANRSSFNCETEKERRNEGLPFRTGNQGKEVIVFLDSLAPNRVQREAASRLHRKVLPANLP
jgi:hypothetical protein